MTVHEGYAVLLKLATKLVNGSTSQSLVTTVDEVDITTKDSTDDAAEYAGGTFRGTLDVEGKLDDDDTYSYSELLAAQQARSAIEWIYSKSNVARTDFLEGAKSWSGNGVITNLRRTDAQNSPGAWACTLRITGVITEGTIASA